MNDLKDNKVSITEFLDNDEKKDLLRLLTAGSVDDGKSTLIGRLLFDSMKLYEISSPRWSAIPSAWEMLAKTSTMLFCSMA